MYLLTSRTLVRLSILAICLYTSSMGYAQTYLNNFQKVFDPLGTSRVTALTYDSHDEYSYTGIYHPESSDFRARMIISHLNPDFTTQWTKAYAATINNQEQGRILPRDLFQTNDQGHVSCGTFVAQEFNDGAYLMKTRPNGDVEWFRTYPRIQELKSVVQTEGYNGDTRYIACGRTRMSNNAVVAVVICTDSIGSIIWAKHMYGTKYDLIGHNAYNQVINYKPFIQGGLEPGPGPDPGPNDPIDPGDLDIGGFVIDRGGIGGGDIVGGRLPGSGDWNDPNPGDDPDPDPTPEPGDIPSDHMKLFALCGDANYNNLSRDRDVLFTIIDIDGNVHVNETYGYTAPNSHHGQSESGISLAQLNDGTADLVIAANTMKSSYGLASDLAGTYVRHAPMLLRVRNNGSVVWANMYRDKKFPSKVSRVIVRNRLLDDAPTGSASAQAREIAVTGVSMTSLFNPSRSADAMLFRTRLTGQPLGIEYFGLKGHENSVSLRDNVSGNIVMIGNSTSFPTADSASRNVVYLVERYDNIERPCHDARKKLRHRPIEIKNVRAENLSVDHPAERLPVKGRDIDVKERIICDKIPL